MSTVDTTYAPTVGFSALGAYLGRDLSGDTGLLPFIARRRQLTERSSS